MNTKTHEIEGLWFRKNQEKINQVQFNTCFFTSYILVHFFRVSGVEDSHTFLGVYTTARFLFFSVLGIRLGDTTDQGLLARLKPMKLCNEKEHCPRTFCNIRASHTDCENYEIGSKSANSEPFTTSDASLTTGEG